MNGEPVDPFATAGEPSLWRRANDPVPYDGTPDDDVASPTAWDAAAVDAAIAACDVPAVRDALRAVAPLEIRAMAALFQQIYYPTRFGTRTSPYGTRCPREPRLDLPFAAGDVTGITFPD